MLTLQNPLDIAMADMSLFLDSLQNRPSISERPSVAADCQKQPIRCSVDHPLQRQAEFQTGCRNVHTSTYHIHTDNKYGTTSVMVRLIRSSRMGTIRAAASMFRENARVALTVHRVTDDVRNSGQCIWDSVTNMGLIISFPMPVVLHTSGSCRSA